MLQLIEFPTRICTSPGVHDVMLANIDPNNASPELSVSLDNSHYSVSGFPSAGVGADGSVSFQVKCDSWPPYPNSAPHFANTQCVVTVTGPGIAPMQVTVKDHNYTEQSI